MRPAFGRLEEITADGRRVVLSFVKNPASYNATLRLIMRRPGRKHVLAAHSNTVVDGEDFAWLGTWTSSNSCRTSRAWSLKRTRAEEVALRMKYAGANPSDIRVMPRRQAALDAALARIPSDEPLYILAGYTPMREFRQIMQRRGGCSRSGRNDIHANRLRSASATCTRGCSAWPGTGELLAITKRCAWRGMRSVVTEADVGEFPDLPGST